MSSYQYRYKPKKKESATAGMSKAELRKLGLQITKTDKSMARKVGDTLRGAGVTTLKSGLEKLDRPREEVFKALFGVEDAKDIQGIKNIKNKKLRGVASFGAEVLLDPLTYITGGTAGLGKTAAKEGIEATLKQQARKTAVKTIKETGARKDAARKILRDAEDAVMKTVYEGGPTVSQIYKRLGSEGLEKLPVHLRGGVKAHIPFTKKQVQLVKEGVTTPFSSKASAAALKIPGVDKTLNKFTPHRQSIRKGGAIGVEVMRAERRIIDETAQTNALHEATLQEINKTFPAHNKEAVGKLYRILEGAEKPSNAKELAAVDVIKKARDESLAALREAGFNVGKIQQALPIVATPKFRSVVYGDLPVQRGAAKTPGFMKQRNFKTIQEANDWARKEYGIDFDAFETNPYKALASHFKQASRSAAEKRVIDRVLIPKGILAHSQFAKATDDMLGAAAKRAGFESKEELQAIIKESEGAAHRLQQIRKTTKNLTPRGGKSAIPIAKNLKQAFAEIDPRFKDLDDKAFDVIRRGSAIDTQATGKLTKEVDKASEAAENAAKRLTKQEKTVERQGQLVAKTEAEFQDEFKRVQDIENALRAEGDTIPAGLHDTLNTLADRLQKRRAALAAAETQLAKKNELVAKAAQRKELAESGLDMQGKPWPIPSGTSPNKLQKAGWYKIEGTSFGQFNGLLAPEGVARELMETFKYKTPGDFMKYYEDVLGTFKTGVTIYFPGFHARNLMGGVFNNFLGGVKAQHYAWGKAILDDKVADTVKLGAHTKGQWKQRLHQQGILNHGRQQLMEFGEAQTKVTGLIRDNPYAGVMSNLARSTEDFVRTAAFLRGYEIADNSFAARSFVMARHGDYRELTELERKIRMVMPFYKWMRTNVPLQINSLVETPGKHLNVQRFTENILSDKDKTAEFEENKYLNPYTEARGGFLAGGLLEGLGGDEAFITPGLPNTDINELSPRGLLAQTLFKGPVEFTTGKRLFGTEGDLKPVIVGREWAFLKPFAKMPGISQYMSRSKGGELMVDQRLLSLLGTANPASRFQSLLGQLSPPAESPQAQVPLPARLSQSFTGIGVQPVTPKSQEMAGYRAQGEMKKLIADLYRREYGEDFTAVKASANKARKKKSSGR